MVPPFLIASPFSHCIPSSFTVSLSSPCLLVYLQFPFLPNFPFLLSLSSILNEGTSITFERSLELKMQVSFRVIRHTQLLYGSPDFMSFLLCVANKRSKSAVFPGNNPPPCVKSRSSETVLPLNFSSLSLEPFHCFGVWSFTFHGYFLPHFLYSPCLL